MTTACPLMEQYEAQLAEKETRLQHMMQPFNPPKIAVFRSPPQHYRMRAEFRIWHESDDLFHIMFDPQTKKRLRIEHFPAASKLINRCMVAILNVIRVQKTLRHKLFQIDYLSTLSGQIVVSLLYHRQLDAQWKQEAAALRETLRNTGLDIQLIGRAAKMKICLDHDYVDECLTINGNIMIYRQMENSFTQPNAEVNTQMLAWAQNITANSSGDLLELYCGNGNFSLALARNFRRVLATEIAKPSVEAAQYNIKINDIHNVQIIRMSAEEFTQAVRGVREFRRLRGIDLQSYQCETIFVDPPRCGLDQATLALVQTYPRIIYISCNPHTLHANLEQLHQTHSMNHLALFDQFPYTNHMECGVMLERR